MAEIRPGQPVRGIGPRGREVTGYYRSRMRNGQHVVDGEPWSGEPERMPRHQYILSEVTPVEGEEAKLMEYASAAKAVLGGGSRDEHVAAIARQTKVSREKVSERLNAAIEEEKSAQRAAGQAAKAKAKSAPRARKAAPPREPVAKVEPAVFAALRDELGLSNKDCAAANEAAGLGSTLSRITELTHSKGAGQGTYEKVERAWREYAATPHLN